MLSTFDERDTLLKNFRCRNLIIHSPEISEWAPSSYQEQGERDPITLGGTDETGLTGYPIWIFVVTEKLVVDPFTGLLDVPKINWLPGR